MLNNLNPSKVSKDTPLQHTVFLVVVGEASSKVRSFHILLSSTVTISPGMRTPGTPRKPISASSLEFSVRKNQRHFIRRRYVPIFGSSSTTRMNARHFARSSSVMSSVSHRSFPGGGVLSYLKRMSSNGVSSSSSREKITGSGSSSSLNSFDPIAVAVGLRRATAGLRRAGVL